MVPPAVVEQQAKLGVSAEESKTQRLKRQQARFRDRGGVFIPSTSNPLVDILLARTVSGESPSKACPKDVAAKRPSHSKAHPASPAHKDGAAAVAKKSQAVAGSSKSKPSASRKGKEKAVEPKADPDPKPAPRRRGAAKGKKKAPDPDSDTEQPLPVTAKPKSTSKGKAKQRAAASTSDGNPKPKPKPKTKPKAKLNPVKKAVEVLVSDDERTLVDVPHKAKLSSKRKIRYEGEGEGEGETDDDVPIVRKRAKPRVDNSKPPDTMTAPRRKTEKIADTRNSGKTLETAEGRTQDEKCPKTTPKKRLVSHDDDEDVTVRPAKKGKTTSAKPQSTLEPESEPVPRPAKNIKKGENPKGGKEKGKRILEPAQDVLESVEVDDDERPLERVPKPEKRQKEEDNYDDRPRKVVKFSETVPPHSLSQKLKENQSDKKCERAVKPSVKDEPDVPLPKLATKPPPRAKTPKGPPREVLERIKASAARHFQCVDSEPDELDCLS